MNNAFFLMGVGLVASTYWPGGELGALIGAICLMLLLVEVQ